VIGPTDALAQTREGGNDSAPIAAAPADACGVRRPDDCIRHAAGADADDRNGDDGLVGDRRLRTAASRA
jgi:hypothetical protein